MLVNIKCTLSAARHPGVVYASVECAGELLINATLDYCLSACEARGYTIENGQEVLLWLHKNTDFVGHSQ
ncbi:hypothetical protein [Acinetobacter sp.]|uniref:hypothetical protein n=1 Tax=Acinetobacter sp. TaxID=472 RepID=UPI00388F9F50